MKINGVEIVDTFAEGFSMWASKVIITGINERWALNSAVSKTGFATSVIACGCEAEIEKVLKREETPDGRPGASILMFSMSLAELEKQIMTRVGQCVMTSPTSACFNGLKTGEKTKSFVIGGKLKVFGDGFQTSKRLPSPAKGKEARRFWRIPVMEGEFFCENEFNAQKAYGGGNFLVVGKNVESVLEACERAVVEIKKFSNVIAPFPGGVVRSGSKVGSKYTVLKASTNDAFCPTLKSRTKTQLNEGENSVLEIVVNSLDIKSMEAAMKKGIEAACTVEGVTRITAGNYGGTLGKFNVHLHKLFGGEVK